MPFSIKSLDVLLGQSGLTQRKLAEEMGIGQDRISDLRTGNNKNPTAKTMDRFYDISRKYGFNTGDGPRLNFYIPPEENSSE